MSRSTHDYLQHILDELHFLSTQALGLSEEQFRADETLKRAFVRSLEIIGEATKQLPTDFRTKHSQIEWRAIARMRDLLIHHYFGVDYQIVWDVIINQVPSLKDEIESLITLPPKDK
jgi:uncharacterized protein with HEPN domain